MILRIRVGSCVVCVDASAAEQVCDVVRRTVRRAKDAGILGADVEEGFCVLRKGAAEVPRDATVKAAGVYPGDPLRLKQQLVAPVKKAGHGAAAAGSLPGKKARLGAARAPAAVSVAAAAAAAAAALPFPAPSESSVSNSFLPEDSDDDAGDAATSSGDVCNSPEPLLSAAASPSHALSPMAPGAAAARTRRQALGGGGGGGGSVRALSPPPLQPLSLQPLSHPGSPASSTSAAVRAKRAGKAELLAPLRHSLGADAASVVGVLPASALSPQGSATAAAGRGIRVRLPDGRVVKLRNMTHQCSVVADVLEAVRMKTGGGGGGDRLASKSGVPLEMDRTLQQCGVASGTTVLYLPDDDDDDGGAAAAAAAAARGSPTPSEEVAAVPLLPSAQSFLPPAVPHSASASTSSATTRRLLQKTHVEASPQCQFTFCSLSPLFGPSLALPACH